jgi:LemA protein
MTPEQLAASFAVLLVVVIITFLAITTYNQIIALHNRISKAWANVDVALKQRYDELPNLVEAVRDVMAWEQDVLTEVTERRAEYSDHDSIPRQAETAEATSSAVRHLFAVVERYPEVKSAGNVAALQDEIARLENLIADRRELYNDQVYRYNTRIAQVPANLLAGVLGWRGLPFFAADDAERERPSANLREA